MTIEHGVNELTSLPLNFIRNRSAANLSKKRNERVIGPQADHALKQLIRHASLFFQSFSGAPHMFADSDRIKRVAEIRDFFQRNPT